jgi:hypothetical protein
MKSLASCMLFLGVAISIKPTQRLGLRQTLAQTGTQASSYANTCAGAINRSKASPTAEAAKKLAASSTPWTDASFTTDWDDSLLWSNYTSGRMTIPTSSDT